MRYRNFNLAVWLCVAVSVGALCDSLGWPVLSGSVFNTSTNSPNCATDSGAIVEWSNNMLSWTPLGTPSPSCILAGAGGVYTSFNSTSNGVGFYARARIFVNSVGYSSAIYGPFSWNFGQSQDFFVNPGGGCTNGFRYTWSAINNTADYVFATVFKNGAQQCFPKQVYAPPGASVTLSWWACGTNDTWSLQWLHDWDGFTTSADPNGNPVACTYGGWLSSAGGSPGTTPDSGGGGSSGTTGSQSGGGPSAYTNLTENPITFPDTNSTPAGSDYDAEVMKQGFGALYDAITKGFAGTAAKLLAVNDAVLGVATNVAGVNNSVLSLSNVVNSGFQRTTNLLGNVTNLLSQSTNWLAGISNREYIASATLTNMGLAISNSVVTGTVTSSNLLLNLSNLTAQASSTNKLWQEGISNVLYGGFGQLTNWLAGISNGIVNGSTNSGGSGTNIFNDAGITNSVNRLGDILTNVSWYQFGWFTNLFDTNSFNGQSSNILAQSNIGGSNSAGTVQGAWDSTFGGFSDPSGSGGFPTEFAASIAAGPGLTWEIDSSTIPDGGVFSAARAFIGWIITLSLCIAMLKFGEKACEGVLGQRQAQGSNQAIFGNNVTVATAAVYAGVISALVAAVPTVLIAYLSATKSSALSGFSFISTMGGFPMAGAVGKFFPVDTAAAAIGTWLVYRYAVGVPFVLFLRTVILWLLA